MGDMLSQAEIDALLGGSSIYSGAPENEQNTVVPDEELQLMLESEQQDILGEIGNISMGTAATTLFALLSQKVLITTPRVKVVRWGQVTKSYDRPCVGVRVDYKEGLIGSNILVLKQSDVKIISNLMMGGDGTQGVDEPLTELDLSAIGEAMNQMIGSSSTSLSSMLKNKIDINTPHPFLLDFPHESSNVDYLDDIGFSDDTILVSISFKMEIGTLINSEIMQLLPIEFAIGMVDTLKSEFMSPEPVQKAPQVQHTVEPPVQQHIQESYAPPQEQQYQTQAPQQAGFYQAQAPPQQAGYYQAPPEGYYQTPPPQPGYNQMPPQGYYQAPPQGYYQVPPQGYYNSPQDGAHMYQQPQAAQQAHQNVNVQPAQFQNFDVSSVIQQKENIDIIMDVPLEVTVELGRTKKKIKEILEFTPGTIIELDKLAGEPIDILVNGKYVASGEVVVIDENFSIRITDIISAEKRI